MASALARLGASAATLAAAVSLAVPASASATTVPASGGFATTATRTVSASTATAVSATSVVLPHVGATGRVFLSSAVLHNAELRGRVAVLVARRYVGIPYVAGGTSPRTGFDCSGYTRYVYSQLGIRLPRVSRDQYAFTRHIAKSQAVPGDLIFFHNSSGRVYHAAIYAGHGYVWHSPHTGSRVKLEKIWTSAYYVGRLKL